MAGEWPVKLLGEVAVNFDSRRVPLSSREREQRRGPYPYYGATGIMDYVDNFLFEGLHVLVAEDGSVERDDGRPFVQLVDGKFWVNNHAHVLRAATNRDTDTRFLFYALSTIGVRPFMTGSVQPKLTQENLNRIPIPYPPEPDRRAIAHILGTLDDKIELNRRMSETLEAMARALFKAWFVDFEPVRAKMEGRWERGQSLPGLPAHLYDLFPDRLVDSELGEIPEGWGVATLGNVAENPRRSVQPYSIPPDTPYIALEHMPRRCIALSDWGTAEGIESNKFEFRKGEILFGKLRPYFHKVGVAPVDGVCSTDIVVVCPRTPHLFAFVLCVVSSDDFVEFTNAGSTGTKMPRTSWADMARYEIALPPDALAQAFNGIVRRQVDRLIAAVHESRTLAALRDALLPKLIRGEIRVKDAERFLEGEGIMSQALRVSHVGFSDESYWNVGRYRSLGLVTTSVDLHASLENELLCLLEKSEVREFKWKKLDGAKERFAAIKMCEFAIENALARKLRVDVLIWDIQDSRHNVPGRDDIANLQRMYYHLFRNVLRARWPNDAVWRLHPDEHTALDWETMRDCLENASVTVEREPSLFTGGEFRIRLRREFGIEEVRPIPSDQHPLLQLADLFAGLAAFSHERFDEYQKWLHTASPKPPLVNEAKACVDPSRASQERFQVLKKFDEACKKRKLGVSLKTKQGLWTPDPQNPINFWLYEPQHPEDKAPQKAKRSV